MTTIWLISILAIIQIGSFILLWQLWHRQQQPQWQSFHTTLTQVQQQISDMAQQQQQQIQQHAERSSQQRQQLDEHQIKALSTLQTSMQQATQHAQQQTLNLLTQHMQHIKTSVEQLNASTQKQLQSIQDQVDKRLSTGFEQTRNTFTDVVKRLAQIDSAQQKITELTNHVVDLNQVLNDKRARGAFGEMQLATLIKDLIPSQHVAFQYTFSNGRRADCVLFLPQPTGTLVVDAKFPLENYQRMQQNGPTDPSHNQYLSQFKQDIKKHIDDVAQKYIIPGETTDSAILFLPSEAIFCEIHANHSGLIQYAQQKRVWLVSPTTMMAVISTAVSVIKDAATRKQVHVIQSHLVALGKDFTRFRTRMQQLAKHIEQAHTDVNQVHVTSQKIASRFDKIEQVDLPTTPQAALETAKS